jgi:hypothetical protein
VPQLQLPPLLQLLPAHPPHNSLEHTAQTSPPAVLLLLLLSVLQQASQPAVLLLVVLPVPQVLPAKAARGAPQLLQDHRQSLPQQQRQQAPAAAAACMGCWQQQ